MKVIDAGDFKKIDENALNKHDATKTGLLAKLGELVKKVINCCIE